MRGAQRGIWSAIMVLALGCPLDASASCGDGVLETGEDCDDGNTVGLDCCSAQCTFEFLGPCDHGHTGVCWESMEGVCDQGVCKASSYDCYTAGLGGKFVVDDRAGAEHDTLSWKRFYGRDKCSDALPLGDPTVDTDYAFCVWSTANDGLFLDALLYQHVIPAGPTWRTTSTGWNYRDVDETGRVIVRARWAGRVLAKGAKAALQGPTNGPEYFGDVVYGLVNSAGWCEVSPITPKTNTATEYRAHRHAYDCN